MSRKWLQEKTRMVISLKGYCFKTPDFELTSIDLITNNIYSKFTKRNEYVQINYLFSSYIQGVSFSYVFYGILLWYSGVQQF